MHYETSNDFYGSNLYWVVPETIVLVLLKTCLPSNFACKKRPSTNQHRIENAALKPKENLQKNAIFTKQLFCISLSLVAGVQLAAIHISVTLESHASHCKLSAFAIIYNNRNDASQFGVSSRM